MKIKRVDIAPFTPKFADGPYVMSYVTQTDLRARVLRLETENGAFGFGELVRRPDRDHAAAQAWEDTQIATLPGREIDALPALIESWRTGETLHRALAYGFDLAREDLRARQRDIPLGTQLGPVMQTDLPHYAPLPSASPDQMARHARAARPHSVLQPRLGEAGAETDRARINAILTAASPDQTIIADFNGAYAADDFLREFRNFTDPRLIWEDPSLSYDANLRIAQCTPIRVMCDMCMTQPSDYERAIRDGQIHSVVIKPPHLGGITTARQVMELCAAASMPYRICGPWSGPIAAMAALHLAMTAPRELLICAAHLSRPFALADDPILVPRPGHVTVPDGPGLGSDFTCLFKKVAAA